MFTQFANWKQAFDSCSNLWLARRRTSARELCILTLAQQYYLLTDYLNSPANPDEKREIISTILSYPCFAANIPDLKDFVERIGKNIPFFTWLLSHYSRQFFEAGLGNRILLFAQAFTQETAFLLGSGVRQNSGNFFCGMTPRQITLFAQGLGKNIYSFVKAFGKDIFLLSSTFPTSIEHRLGKDTTRHNLIGTLIFGLKENVQFLAQALIDQETIAPFFQGLAEPNKIADFCFALEEYGINFFAPFTQTTAPLIVFGLGSHSEEFLQALSDKNRTYLQGKLP